MQVGSSKRPNIEEKKMSDTQEVVKRYEKWDSLFKGTFEIHIFVEPLDAPQEILDKFREVCNANKMKALFLVLDFKHVGPVGVPQSSRYVTGTMEDARRVCREDVEVLTKGGFKVIREKIEAVAGITQGVPETKDDDVAVSPDHYFEYHIQVQHKGQATLAFTKEEDERLREISRVLEQKLDLCVPVSWNSMKESQRFLNTRTYGLGKAESYPLVESVVKALEEEGLQTIKVIREFIVSDSNKSLDNGWLEPLPA